MGKGGSNSQVVGYKYALDVLLGWCIGPVDAVVAIKANNLLISGWSGGVGAIPTDNSIWPINAPTIFGGDDKEGGVQGTLEVQMGADSQTVNPAIKGMIGGNVSDMRGICSTYFSGLICSNNPYPKPWSGCLERALKGWYNDNCWYPNEAWIGLDGTDAVRFGMNPAHIIYECMTNPVWGRGFPASQIDEPSFIDAANALCDESFGLNFSWSRATDLDEFISIVVNHIGAALYTDRITGLYALKLLRADYDATTLPLFDYSSGLLSIEEDVTTAPDTSHNELVVNFIDNTDGTKRQIRIQNLAGIQASQSIASTSVDYLGCSTAELAARVGQRDMSIQAAGIRKFTLKMDRRARKIQPGGVFRISAPDRNIGDMVLRCGSVEQGALADQTLTVKAMMDVFALENTTYVVAPPQTWVPPDHGEFPDPPDVRRMDEINYRDVVRAFAGDPARLAAVDPTDGDPVIVAKQKTSRSTNYVLLSRTNFVDPWVDRGRFPWTPLANLAAGIGAYDTTITLTNAFQITGVAANGIAWLENELVEISSIDLSSGIVMTIRRGCVDTIPQRHNAGAVVWFPEGAIAADGIEYAIGDDVHYGLETQTQSGLSSPSEDVWTIIARQGMPYAPGFMKANGLLVLNNVDLGPTLDINFTGEERNRLTQADTILASEDPGVASEAGTTYTFRFYDGSSTTPIRTEAGLSTPNYFYDNATYVADGAPGLLRVEVESVRGGITSYQKWNFTINRTGAPLGWGYRWGSKWGRP